MKAPTMSSSGVALRALPMLALGSLLLAACPGPKDPLGAHDKSAGCKDSPECGRAQQLLAAASAFGNVTHEYLLDPTSSLSPGRGIERTPAGMWSVTPTACADAKSRPEANVEAATIDFSFVGVAVDSTLVGADADITPFVSVGAEGSTHTVRLVAMAFVRDKDPQFFKGTDAISYERDLCSCGRATHFVGSVKYGGLLAYEMTVRKGEAHGRALDFVKARVAATDASLHQTSVGGIEVEGLEAALAGGTSAKPLTFKVKNPVPIAYAAYPVSDVCKFAFPAPEVTPMPVDFGVVPADREATRLVHVQNRASIDLTAYYNDHSFSLPAEGSLDIPLVWRPSAQTAVCEAQTREETLTFVPTNRDAPVVPKQHTVRVVERVQTGNGSIVRREHIDTGEARRPDYAATERTLTCPKDYVPSACRIEKPECGDGGNCSRGGYSIVADETADGCKVKCKGPTSMLTSSNYCRFDVALECTLRCAPAKDLGVAAR